MAECHSRRSKITASPELRAVLQPWLRQLEPEDRAIMRWYFADCLTQREIGRRVGVCQMQVSRRLDRCLSVLREQARAAPAGGG